MQQEIEREEKEYKETLEYILNHFSMFSKIGQKAYKPGLEKSLQIADHFGNPHKKFKSIHIGGTNGKGSTSHLLASVLQAQGYKVGLFTSPHLIDYRERIRINGKMIPQREVIDFINNWKKSGFIASPSFYEISMIMAFDWFAREKVDYAIIEVGLGGRLDSTNIITPLLSIITNISDDHSQILGDTLEKIAEEKAGIIKKDIPVIIGESQEETDSVFIKKAMAEGAPIFFANGQKSPISLEKIPEGWKCESEFGEFILPLGGDYQKKNIVTLLTAVRVSKNMGISISNEAIKSGIENVVKNTGLRGRWNIVSLKPLVIADGGHNIGGFTYNMQQLKDLMESRTDAKLRIILGFMADKAIDKIIDTLPLKAYYYLTNSPLPRALPKEELLNKIKGKGIKSARTFPSVINAYEAAKKEASGNDVIFVGGSLVIVGDFLLYLDSCGGRDS